MSDNIKVGDVAFQWLKKLNPEIVSTKGDDHYKGDRAAIAHLRHSHTIGEVLRYRPAIDLMTNLGFEIGQHKMTDKQEMRLAKIAAIAGSLPFIKIHSGESFPTSLGKARKGENPLMSPLRFSRLMAAQKPDDVMRQMRRAIRLAKGTANIGEIAEYIYFGTDGQKVRWTYAYWQGSHVQPDKANKDRADKEQSAK